MKLKKIEEGNPLANFHLWDDLDAYNAIQTDEELVNFHHELLTKYDHRPLVIRFIWQMINYSANGEVYFC